MLVGRAARLAAACLAIVLLAAPFAYGSAVDDANAGLDALNRADYATAVRLFTQALSEGGMSDSDRELAYVKRAQAYLGEARNDLARQDLGQALRLEPDDQEAAALMRQAEAQPRPQSRPAAAPSNGPRTLMQAQNWVAAVNRQGDVTECYAYTKVQDSIPSVPHRGSAMLFVVETPSARDTVLINAGFNYPKNESIRVEVGAVHIDFDTNHAFESPIAYAWNDRAAVAAFEHGSQTVVQSQTGDGQIITDSFSLAGFTAAYAAIVKACPSQRPAGEAASAANGGARSWLGIRGADVTPKIAESMHLPGPQGMIVISSMRGGAADKAGIKPGDVVEMLDGHSVTGFHDFASGIAETPVGQVVGVRVWRDGQELTLQPTTEARP